MGFFDFLFLSKDNIKNRKRNEFNKILSALPRYEITLCEQKFKRNSAKSLDIECRSITKTSSLKKLRNFVAIDTETTGIELTGNYIIEISAVKFVDFEPVEVFETLVKPPKAIPANATKVNGITDAMVANAPNFSQLLEALDDYIDGAPIVAHNALFDVRHIYVNGYKNIENSLIYDTLKLSRKIITPKLDNYKLATACAHYGIYFDGAHRATADAMAAGMLFTNLLAQKKGTRDVNALKTLLL